MENLTKEIWLIWDYHGSGQLIGIFDDPSKLEDLQKEIHEKHQQGYIRIEKFPLNRLVNKIEKLY